MKYLLLSAFLLLSISLTLNAMEYGCCKTQLFPEIPDPSPSEESQQGDSDSNPYLGHHLLFYKPELTVKQVVCPVNPDYEPKEVTPEQREYFKQKTNALEQLIIKIAPTLFSQLFEVYHETLPYKRPPFLLLRAQGLIPHNDEPPGLTQRDTLKALMVTTKGKQYLNELALKRYKNTIINPDDNDDLPDFIEQLTQLKDSIRGTMIANMLKNMLQEDEVDTIIDTLKNKQQEVEAKTNEEKLDLFGESDIRALG